MRERARDDVTCSRLDRLRHLSTTHARSSEYDYKATKTKPPKSRAVRHFERHHEHCARGSRRHVVAATIMSREWSEHRRALPIDGTCHGRGGARTEACPQRFANRRRFSAKKQVLRVAQFRPSRARTPLGALNGLKRGPGTVREGVSCTLKQPRAHRSCARVAVNFQLRPSTRAI